MYDYFDPFPTKLRELVGEKRGALKALADAIGVAPSNVTLYTTGQTRPSKETLAKLAEHFGIRPEELITEQEYEERRKGKRV